MENNEMTESESVAYAVTMARFRQLEERKLQQAKEVKCCPHGYFWEDRHFHSLEELRHTILGEVSVLTELPAYAYCALPPQPVFDVNAKDLINQHILYFGVEGQEVTDFEGVDELDLALTRFKEMNQSRVVVYHEDPAKYVVLDWSRA